MQTGLKVGDVLAHRYRIVKLIGEGGMGRVFAAEDLKLGNKRWAVKEMTSDPANGQVEGEIDVLLRLSHPQLPKVADCYRFADSGKVYMIMELVEGRTIRQIVERKGRMQAAHAARIVQQLCDILDYLHTLKPEPIIYRDLKPDHVIIDDNGTIHLVDFGISRTYKSHRKHDTLPLGSLGFLAPEQLRGVQSNARTDLYQLGSLLFYMLSGGRLVHDEESLAAHLPTSASGMYTLLKQLLNELPEDRPSSASAVRAALATWLDAQDDTHTNDQAGHAEVKRGGRGAGTIVVGSLYPGAGSTRTSFDIAAACSEAGVTCSLIEYAHLPEHALLLGGEPRMPHAYEYLVARASSRCTPNSITEWRDGEVIYYPLPPEEDGSMIPPERWYRSFMHVRTDVIIIEIGTHWHDRWVHELLGSADHIICMIDSQQHKWYRKDAVRTLERLAEVLTERKNVHVVARQLHTDKPSWPSFPLPIAQKIAAKQAGRSALERYTAILAKMKLGPRRRARHSSTGWMSRHSRHKTSERI